MSRGEINVYTCPAGHETVTKDLDNGVTPFMIGCKVFRCQLMARSSMYQVDQSHVPEWEWYKPKDYKGLTMGEIDHVIKGGLMIRKIQEPDKFRPVHQFIKVGARVWHPMFLWGKVTNPPTITKTLIEFEFESISYNIAPGQRKTFKKNNGENVVFTPNFQLFEQELKAEDIPEVIADELRARAPDIVLEEEKV